ncbi:MAG: TPM domain-containing protein [Rubrivivax sp.]|nr:TPM domain-containing protein [Rubrivivax sp.]
MGMLDRLGRMLRHGRGGERELRRALDPEALARLQVAVAGSEQHHSGEIRISVEAGLPLSYVWHDLTARDRAITLFGKLRVWDTEHNNGVLIYLLLAEHAIEIVADRGLVRHVSPAQWDTLVAGMRDNFRAGRFQEGLAQAVDAVDGLLRRHFPLQPGQTNPNELPDAADLR